MRDGPSGSDGYDSKSNIFAIIHTWPDLKNAEYEVLQRLLGAAANIGARPVVMDRNGLVLWCHPDLDFVVGEMPSPDSIAFVLSMHFESGRVLDVYSYVTLWQPIEFYHDFGYQKSIDKVTSYNDLVSCDSDLADAHGMNMLSALGRAPQLPLPRLFHMLPEPFLAPKTCEDSKLFYIGINWERVGRPRGRFHETLMNLDRQGLLDIYGPEKVMGVATWEGYDSYQGELPFDGVSVKKAINRCGICLVLSSAAHKSAGVMSNRLFEGLTGGAAIVASPHPIIDRYFRDVVYLVDDTHGEDLLGRQIIEAVREIRSNPEEARRRTAEGQRILREQGFLLEASLQRLIDETPARSRHFESEFLAAAEVTVILTHRGDDLEGALNHLDQFARQKQARINLHIVCGERFFRRHGRALAAAARGSVDSVTCHRTSMDSTCDVFGGPTPSPSRTGPVIADILRAIETPYFAFFGDEDQVFSDHFASAAKVFSQQPDAMVACTGMITQSETADGKQSRNFESARFSDYASIVLVSGVGERGRFVYRSGLIDNSFEHLMKILDGEEESYFRLSGFLAGPMAQTNYASYVLHQPTREIHRPSEPVEHQRQYIRDRFARDPRWLKHLSSGAKIPEFVYAYSPGTPIRWQDYQAPMAVAQRISPNTRMATREGGDGLRFLTSGFSYPEPDFVWLQGERGIINFAMPRAEIHRHEDYVLVLSAEGRRSLESGRNQHVTIAINGMVTHYAEIPDRPTEIDIRIPKMLMKGVSTFQVEITPDHTEAVYDDTGAVTDPRLLSLKLSAVILLRSLQTRPPILCPNETYACGEGQPGADALLSHFHSPEPAIAWIAGKRGVIWFRLSETPVAPELRMIMVGRRSLTTGKAPVLKVSVNGRSVGVCTVGEGHGEVTVDLSGADLSDNSAYIELMVAHAEAVFDEDHKIIDKRLLGAGVVAFGVFEKGKVLFDEPAIVEDVEIDA